MILVDYKCPACGDIAEIRVAVPVPAAQECRCGASMRRVFSAAGLVGATPAPASQADLSCAANRHVPGFCHLGPAARRAALAKWTGDDTTYAAEVRRQTQRYETSGPPPLTSVFNHVHASPAPRPDGVSDTGRRADEGRAHE